MATRKQLKMVNFVNHRMRVEMKDGRQITGQMLGFDRHMNVVLVDAEELRKTRRKVKGQGEKFLESEEKRTLGMLIVRGAEIVGCTADGPPPADPSARLGSEKQAPVPATATAAAPGISRPAGRGSGLQGPAVGVGGPAFGGPAFGGFPPPGGFPGGPQFGGPPGGFGRGFAPPPPGGAPGFPGFQGGPPPGFQQQFPPGGRGFPPPGGYQGR
ncbi:hypothetical protein AMS68_005950 [Peltaster fructicola]|uniref:Sm protein B n=1 Tax=Peltaster fructicola TaxID=286661 RepID=A0A6H0Y095_9PEZI|nr:hypothetical protein AMS68_005950 [Peltaster fructicola]